MLSGKRSTSPSSWRNSMEPWSNQQVWRAHAWYVTLRSNKRSNFLSITKVILASNHHNFYYVVPVAKWKKLIAKTVKTRERFRGYDASLRESSTIPGIELYDIIDGKVLFLPIDTLLWAGPLFYHNDWLFFPPFRPWSESSIDFNSRKFCCAS